jgi:chemotaxis signal transduction protein
MELKASKKGDPMVSIWFKILEGEFKNSIIFYNQVITQGFHVHFVNEMLRMMVSELEDAPAVEFKSYKQYGNLIMDIFEAINDNYEFVLSYKKGKKDFSTYEIKEVFVLE